MSSVFQWLTLMAPSLTFALCHVPRVDLWAPRPDVPLTSARWLFETRNTNNETPSENVCSAHLHIWPTFTFSLAAAYLRLRNTRLKCKSRPTKQKICWEELRTPADFRRLRWLLSSDWTAGCDLHLKTQTNLWTHLSEYDRWRRKKLHSDSATHLQRLTERAYFYLYFWLYMLFFRKILLVIPLITNCLRLI